MADYYAVLQRTLSGFTDPKPQLRTKLYERARTTIARQLENRTPPVTGAALTAELNKLEQAIAKIEQGYGEAIPAPVVAEPESPPVPQPQAVPEPVQEPLAADPVFEELAIPAAPTVAEFVEPTPELASIPVVADPVSDPVAELHHEPVGESVRDQLPEFQQPVVAQQIDEFFSDPEVQPPTAPSEGLPTSSRYTPQSISNDDAMDQWAKEFLAVQPAPSQELPQEAPLSDVMPEQAYAAPASVGPAVAPIVAPAAESIPPTDTGPQFGDMRDDSLSIPPAPGFGPGGSKRTKRRSLARWILLLILLLLLGGIAAYAWVNKDLVLEKTGLSDLLDDPTRPKPVKTISITPEPADVEAPEATVPEPKSEDRLGEDGQETDVAISTPTITPTLEPETPVSPTTGAPPVAQNAILYEEGAVASQNSIDAGRVVWSVVQEAPGAGEAAEPAIRGRIDIPSRNVVLIMTIKRNTDRALPASHLIELVFAVPDDFSGGAVSQINRFVLKESEQGRGEGLIGVPARIADGIFLIALNNLEETKAKNESLLQSRDWIDVPMQYRTGRRALMTIEKGVPGEKVFKQVFDAWAKL